MVDAMTASRVTIHREDPKEWPKFAGRRDVPLGLRVVSIEVRRLAEEPIQLALTTAATVLVAALCERLLRDRNALTLVALERPRLKPNRLAMYYASRYKLWTALERDGFALPEGPRIEEMVVSTADAIQFAGAITFPLEQLPVALEVARSLHAVCLGVLDGSSRVEWRELVTLARTMEGDTPLLEAALARAGDGIFAARAFGEFDDIVVGVDIFSAGEALRVLEGASRSVASALDGCVTGKAQ
jgi:hypothetical protein